MYYGYDIPIQLEIIMIQYKEQLLWPDLDL